MASGTVKWFNDSMLQMTGKMTFLSTTRGIQAEGFKSLSEGDKVTYEVTQGPKGLQAEKVVKAG